MDFLYETVEKYYIVEILTVVFLSIALRWVLIILNWLFRRLGEEVRPFTLTIFPTLKIKSFEIFRPSQLIHFFQGILRLVYTLGIFISIYFYLSLVLGVFNFTRNLSEMLLQGIQNIATLVLAGFVSYLPNLASILLIIFISHYVLKFLHLILSAIGNERILFSGFPKEWAEPTYKIARFFIYLFVLVMIAPLLPGFDSPAFQAVSVFLGVLISLGSSTAISNTIAGMLLIYMRAFELGERIEVKGIQGDVVEKSLLATRLRTINNEEITIPNTMLLSNPTVNYTRQAKTNDGLVLTTAVTIGYDIPWRKVHELLLAAGQQTPQILDNPAPEVYQKALDDFYVRYELRVRTHHSEQMAAIYSALHQNIQDAFAQAGVEITSPHFRAQRTVENTLPPEPNLT